MSMFTLEEVNQAINMAVDETSRKAVEVLSSVLDNWVQTVSLRSLRKS